MQEFLDRVASQLPIIFILTILALGLNVVVGPASGLPVCQCPSRESGTLIPCLSTNCRVTLRDGPLVDGPFVASLNSAPIQLDLFLKGFR